MSIIKKEILYGTFAIFIIVIILFIGFFSLNVTQKENLAGEAFMYELYKVFTTCEEDEFWTLISSSQLTEEVFSQYASQTNCESILDSTVSITDICGGIKGDIENDGDLEISDARFLFEFLLFGDFFPGISCGDLNSDNSITYLDLVVLINAII